MVKKIKTTIESIIEYGFYLWLFLLPWQTRYFFIQGELNNQYFETASVVLYVSEIALVVLLLLKLFIWWLENKKDYFSQREMSVRNNLFPLGLIIFVSFSALSWVWSIEPSLTTYYSVKLFLALGVFWLVGTRNISLWRISSILIAAGVVQGFFAINQFLLQMINASKWLGIAMQDSSELGVSVVDTGMRRWLRSYGGFPHPNILGGFLVIVLVMIKYQYFKLYKSWQQFDENKAKIYGAVLLSSLMIVASGLALSFSRAAWLAAGGVFLSSFIYLFFQKAKDLRIVWLKLFIVFVLTFAVWTITYPQPFTTRLKGMEMTANTIPKVANIDLEIKSIVTRKQSLFDGKNIVAEKWLTGTGLGVYNFYLSEIKPTREAWELQPPHMVFLLILAELGIIGLVLFLLLLYLLLTRAKSLVDWLMLLALLFLFLFDHWWWSLNFGWYLMMLCFGLIYYNKIDKR